MDIHKPKPVHDWRSFLAEVGIIVLGVLIAIFAEQAVEALHWSQKVVAARGQIRIEIARNDAYYAFRVAAAPCVVRRLTALTAITENVAAHRREAPVGEVPLHLGDLLNDNAWQAERADQTLTHFRRAELERLAALYAQQNDIHGWLNQEEDIWGTLSLLEGDPNRLGPAEVSQLRNALQQARRRNFLVALTAATQIAQSRRLGIEPPRASAHDLAVSCAPLARTAKASGS